VDIVLAGVALYFCDMPTNTPNSPSAPDDRRAYYRVTVVLPISLQDETDIGEEKLIEESVNISGGGIGMMVSKQYDSDAVLLVTVRFPDDVVFKTFWKVMAVEPLTATHRRAYRLRGRFIRMSAQDRELLIRYIMRFHRDHLQKHYMA